MPKKETEYEKYLLHEKYLWFLGSEDLLADFYNNDAPSYIQINTRESYYYSNVASDIRVVHSGFPSLLSYTKAKMLVSGGISALVKVDGKDSEKKNEEATMELDDINDDNKIDNLIVNSATTQSWGKKFAWKISIDKDVTDYPILEKVTPFNYNAIYERGRLKAIVFNEEFSVDKTDFVLHEIYSKTNGSGTIVYELYQVGKKELIQVSLESTERTTDLEDKVFKGFDFIFAGEKVANKSDYQGLVSEFDALDEVWSQLMDEIRKGRNESYIPENLAQGKTFDKFRKNYTVVGTDDRENGANKIENVQPSIRTDEHTKAINALKMNILTLFGLSPITVGIAEDIGSNSSGDALAKREMASIRTRNHEIKEWDEFLQDMYYKVLNAYNYMRKKKEIGYEILIAFGQYITPTRSEAIADVKLMRDAGVIDVEKALKDIYGDDLTEEEKVRIIQDSGTEIFIPEV